jgi:methyl-accepting chemotaxis protein
MKLPDFVRRIRISTSLSILFGLCVLIMAAQAGVSLYQAWTNTREANNVVELGLANRELFVAMQNVRNDRGTTRVALEAKDAADPQFVAVLHGLRAKSTPAVDALVAICRNISCGDGDAADRIRRAADKSFGLRKEADAALAVPLAQRRPGIGKEWNDNATVLVNELERTSTALADAIRKVDAEFAELVGIKEAAWIARDGVGLERTFLLEVFSSKMLKAESTAAMLKLRGQAEAGWRTVKMLTSGTGVRPSIAAAVRSAGDLVFERYSKTAAAIEKTAQEHKPLPLTEAQFLATSNEALDALVAVCSVALDEIIAHAGQRTRTAETQLAVNGTLLALSVAIGLSGFLFARQRIGRPIGALARVMLRMADGDLSCEIPASERRDEIGDVARAAVTFRDGLVRMRTLEAEQRAGEERAAADAKAAEERERSQRREAEERAAAERKAAMHALAERFEQAVGGIIENVSAASSELETAAHTLTGTAETTQQLSTAVASASEEASANVQSVASATEEMTGSVNEISRQVQESSAIADQAVAQAQRTNARIEELSGAANRIGDVVKLITAIAEQTNLLALNATIEAARAGDAGRGFAVVAHEVKALAAQTAKATGDIGTQIAGMQQATNDSVAAIKEIGTTIGRISEIATTIAAAVEEQGAATGEIARNVQEAAKGTTQVAANITDVNRGASETGSSSSQVLLSAQSLATESNRLKVEVQKFLMTVRAA